METALIHTLAHTAVSPRNRVHNQLPDLGWVEPSGKEVRTRWGGRGAELHWGSVNKGPLGLGLESPPFQVPGLFYYLSPTPDPSSCPFASNTP